MAHHLHIVLDDDTQTMLDQNAKSSGLTKTAYLRSLITGTPIKQCPAQELRQLYYEVNSIGVNINQIARNVNAGIACSADIQQALFLQRINLHGSLARLENVRCIALSCKWLIANHLRNCNNEKGV